MIGRLRTRLPEAPPGELWLGDDAAVVAGGWVLSTDTLVAGLDWDPRFSTTADVGWKAVMVNASDLAAMAAATERLLVTLVAASDFDVDDLFDGITEACAVLGAHVIGGDLSAAPTGRDVVVVSITAAGHCPGNRPVTRAGAKPGDALWLTGPVGAAAAGLRMLRAGDALHEPCVQAHLRPSARVGAGVAAAAAGATAMIDISDGLAADAWHVARASGLALDFEHVPVADGATFDEAVAGGDDYELLCAAPTDVDVPGWVRIGVCRAGPAEVTVAGEPVEPRGYRHWRQA